MITIAVVGAFTALFAATIALRQFDLKKVFAYSTISQLGFMFVGVGVLAPVAGVFHLVTHAFFKALLFLSSGVVMHAMGGVLDMRKMSGLKTVLPKTHMPDADRLPGPGRLPVLQRLLLQGRNRRRRFGPQPACILGLVLLFTAFLTAYYTFRLYFRVFEGPLVIPAPPADGARPRRMRPPARPRRGQRLGHPRPALPRDSGVDEHLDSPAHHAATDDHGHGARHGDHGHHNHEPLVMILPLIVLAIGAVLAGYLNWPDGSLGDVPRQEPVVLDWPTKSPTCASGAAVEPPARRPRRRTSAAERQRFDPPMMVVSGAGRPSPASCWPTSCTCGPRRGRALAAALPAAHRAARSANTGSTRSTRRDRRAAAVAGQRRSSPSTASWSTAWSGSSVGSRRRSGWFLKFTVQRGYLQGYAVAMLFGIVIILLLMFYEIAWRVAAVVSCQWPVNAAKLTGAPHGN